ncbi:MAG TPA: ABC transporter substrate-binding protein [Stellaceae bacterium]|nr:ABC transporter substrate-binding protein [Stellaceae bacterium]
MALVLAILMTSLPARAASLALRYGQAFSAEESIYALPILVADREGFFAREGLAVSTVLVPGGGERMIAALEDGTVNLAHVATAFLVSADMKGADAVAIVDEFANPIYSLVAKPEIATFADLKGRTVGLAEEGGTVAYATRLLLARNGIGAGDFTARTVSGTPARIDCLKRGLCDAVPLGQPQDFVALGAGFRLLGRTDEAVPAFLYTVTAARRAWAEAHSDAVVRYVRALAAAFAFIHDRAQRTAVAGIVAEASGASTDAARRTLALYLEPDRKVLPRRAELDLAGLGQVIGFMAESRLLAPPLPPPERFADTRYVKAGAD